MKYLILGNGYIGNYLARKIPESEIYKWKISHITDVYKLLLRHKDRMLINCVGKTGKPNIDWCELNKEETFRSNVELPIMIAEACKKMGRKWVHIGSGCIYTGYEKEWTEEDAPIFYGSFYSKTKAWSQEMLKRYPEVLVLRIRMPIDEDLHPRCYISKIVRYAKEGKDVFDLQNSMTALHDLADVLQHLTCYGYTGEYNVVNKSSFTIPRILDLYKECKNEKFVYGVAAYERIRETLKADRSNCILSIDKLERSGYTKMPTIEARVWQILKGEKLS
jgi:3,5-epimerase/4-reductase